MEERSSNVDKRNHLRKKTPNLLWVLVILVILANCGAIYTPTYIFSTSCDVAFHLATADGLTLTLSDGGEVAGLEIDGVQLVTDPAPPLQVRDMSHAADPSTPNLLTEPGFETSAGWSTLLVQNAAITLTSSSQSRSGTHSLEIAATGQVSGEGTVIADPVPVTPGNRYRVSAYFLSQKGYVLRYYAPPDWQRNVYRYQTRITGLYLWWIDDGGQLIGDFPDLAVPLHVNAGEWRRLTREVTAPENAAAVSVVVAALPDGGDTIWVDDAALVESPEENQPVTGEVVIEGEALVQRGQLPEAGLVFTTTYTAHAGHIAAHVQVADTTGEERALEVSWGVPIDAQDWRWWDSIRASRAITAPTPYANAVSADFSTWMPMSLYPVAVIENGAQGLALASPMGQPRVTLLSYDGTTSRLEGRAFLGISPQATHLGPHTDFTLYLYRTDPAWGLRSALARLRDFHPEWFDSTIASNGFEGFEQGEFTDPVSAQRVVELDSQGVYAAQYTLPELQVEVGPASGPPPSPAETLTEVEACAAGTGGCTAGEQVYAQALLTSTVHGVDGDPVLKGVDVFPWAPSVWTIVWTSNPDPDLENGHGQHMLGRVDQAFSATLSVGAELDGVQVDNLMATPTIDLRPDHIAIADVPLTYCFNTYRPGVHTMAAMAEYLAALRAHLDTYYGQDKGITANFWGLATVNALGPWIDGFGAEGDVKRPAAAINNWNQETLDYRRAIGAGPRFQLYAIQEADLSVDDIEVAGQMALFYGIELQQGPHGTGWITATEEAVEQYASLARMYNGLGWEPIPYARTDHADVAVERFGIDVFTVRNWGEESVTYELRVDTMPLGVRRVPGVTELTAGGPVSSTLDGGILIIEDTLEPGQTHVFQTESASFSLFLPCVLN